MNQRVPTEPASPSGLLRFAGSRLVPVPARLARWVKALWIAEHAPGQAVHALPDGTVDVVCALGEAGPGWYVTGPLRRYERHTQPFSLRLVGASLQPGAASMLGLAADRLLAEWQPLGELALSESAGLVRATERAALAGAHDAALVEAVGSFIEARVARTRFEPRVAEALAVLHTPTADGPSVARVGELAHELGMSDRTLLRLFERHLGLTPKTYARIARFQHALARCRRGHIASLAELALSAGYADQAHLTREFVELGGITPSALVRAQKGIREP